MRNYVIDSHLGTSSKEKWASAGISAVITCIIVFLMYYLHIRVPNPPFQTKNGELMLDFGLEEVSYGRPTDGGPSAFPPAKGGGETSEAISTPNPSTPSGGQGDIVNTTDAAEEMALPPIDPPASSTPAVNSRLQGLSSKIGKRTGTSSNGDPNGIEGGQGNVGFGGTTNNGGVFGNGGKRTTRNTGNGFYTAKGFANHTITSDVKKVEADGVGEIHASVTVPCSGAPYVKSILPSGNYSGTSANAKAVIAYFLSKSKFIKDGEKCPETGTIILNIKKGL
jgi:hypothetical protein